MLKTWAIILVAVSGGPLLGQQLNPAVPPTAEQVVSPTRRTAEPTAAPTADPVGGRAAAARPAPRVSRPLISLAGETVSIQPPPGWHVWERPTGREVRLLITPTEAKPKAELHDGIWICFHHPSVSDPRIQTAERMTRRFPKLARQGRIIPGPRMPIEIQQAKGLQQEFHLHDEANGSSAGVHILADTAWGTLEFFAVASAKDYADRKREIQSVLQSIQLEAPRAPTAPADTARAATPILGSWKAFRSRIHLQSGGKVSVVLDKPTRLTTRVTRDGSSKPPRRLVGRFVAERDLIYVTWKDGSRLNLRWRLENGQLLLTDHQGQTAQLHRIVQ